MALTGELSDLSLAELIEFFCNQRKTGRLKVVYTSGPGYFYLQAGSVVHARIGVLRGIEAVYYALTLPNASFTFSPAFEAPEHTINQPWTSVVLEGLRRMDEGIAARTAFPEHEQLPEDESKVTMEAVSADSVEDHVAEDEPDVETDFPSDPSVEVKTFVPQFAVEARRGNRPWSLGAVAGAVALIVAVIGVPWGWYAHNKAARLANETRSLTTDNAQTLTPPVVSSEPSNGMANEVSNEAANNTSPVSSESEQPTSNSEADLAAKRQREARAKELAKTREASTAAATTLTTPKDNSVAVNPTAPKTQSSPNTGAKRVTVQVTYDENGRVTQASGGDATALRIARQKRFPAGKAGSTTITIPIN